MKGAHDIAGLVLAGGKSLRFGGPNKAFQLLGGRPLIAHALRPLRSLSHIAINANRRSAELAALALPIVADIIADGGPLGGIHAGLCWAARLREIRWLATVPVDLPFLPDDLITRLAHDADESAVTIAAAAGDFSPVTALWRIDQLPVMSDALERGVRKMTDYLAIAGSRQAELAPQSVDALFNINTAERLAQAEPLLAEFERGRSELK